MKTYEIMPGLHTRGELKESHLDDLLEGSWAVVALTTRPNETLQREVSHYYHHPLPDGRVTPAVEERVWAAVRQVVDLHEAGIPVIVHCHAGRNRAALVASLAYAVISKVPFSEALKFIRGIRPRAVANPHFEEYLSKNTLAGEV